MQGAFMYAPRPFGLVGSSSSPSSSSSSVSSACISKPAQAPMASPSSVRIAVVGDTHDQWNLEEDRRALEFLKPDLVLFTGDFGNENVELVRSVASLEVPKAAILGNHDSWKTQKFYRERKDNVQLQLECLGEEHVAYRRLDFPQLKLSIVGGRPFSCGGEQLFRKKLLSQWYGVEDMDQSARRIYRAAMGAPEDHLVIFLAHNGPTGLGANVDDICGRDWVNGGGDHGDPDLAKALSLIKETAKFSIPLVVFGHMHKRLANGNGLRKMIVVSTDNTIYLNGAIVPRVRLLTGAQASTSSIPNGTQSCSAEHTGSTRAFTLVEILEGKVARITESWVSMTGDKTKLEEEHILFMRSGHDNVYGRI